MARNRRDQIGKENLFAPLSVHEADAALYGQIAAADSSMATVQDDGTIQLGSFTLTRVGLTVASAATYEEWDKVGTMLRRLDASIQWLIGDWMAFGERQYNKTYAQVAEATGYEEKTLYQYAWVASKVNFSVRTEKLSFTHHQLVAHLATEEQQRWLEWAVENKVSVAQMRKAMRGERETQINTEPEWLKASADTKKELQKTAARLLKAEGVDKTLRWLNYQQELLTEMRQQILNGELG